MRSLRIWSWLSMSAVARALRVAGVAFGVVLLVVGPGAAQPSGNDGVIGVQVTDSADQVRRLWTEERIKQALKNPMLPIRGGEPKLHDSVPADDEIRIAPPSNPASPATPAPLRLLPRKPVGAPSCPVTRYEWSYDTNNREYPQRVVGVLFFEDVAGSPFVCSASLVNKRLLLTAGHCVASGNGQWHKNFMWAPGYLNGDRPFGEAFGESVLTFPQWFNSHDFSFDVAFMILTEPRGEELGWLGLTTGGAPDSRNWRQNGYPAAPPYDGSKLAINVSSYGARDCGFGGPCTVAVGSPLTGGSSGGPWINQQQGDNFANGVNS